MTALAQNIPIPAPVQRLAHVLGTLSPAALFATLFAMGLVLWQGTVFNDPDTFWHIAAGGWMIDHREALHRDVFSHTFAGKPWATHEWLPEIVMASAFKIGGCTGVILLFAGSMGLAAWLLARGIGRWLGPLGQAVAL